VDAKDNAYLFKKYMDCINESLRHTNPTVRKQAESLFKVLHSDVGDMIFSKLEGQKS